MRLSLTLRKAKTVCEFLESKGKINHLFVMGDFMLYSRK